MLELLAKRRSIRKYLARPIEAEKIDILKEAVLRAPSSRALNPWEFIFVTEAALLERLAKAKRHGSSFVKDAPLAVAIAADPNRCDVWIEDCSIAATILQLTAESLGLGSCWCQIRMRDRDAGQSAEGYVKEVLGLPEGHVVEALIAVGHPAEEKKGHPTDSLLRERIHENRYVAERKQGR